MGIDSEEMTPDELIKFLEEDVAKDERGNYSIRLTSSDGVLNLYFTDCEWHERSIDVKVG